MVVTTLKGSPSEMGKTYGEKFKEKILSNIDRLVTPNVEKLLAKPGFHEWKANYDRKIEQELPWYKAEMEAIAEAVGVPYDTILMLNLRAWQYELYSGRSLEDCSSFIIRLASGADMNGGALDDPHELYCGPVRYIPDEGYAFVSFPITGTSWGNRGMNCKGLTMGISSQLLPGLKGLETMWNQDVAMRAILQTCATVDEVREYCRTHAFTINLVVSDAKGGRLCIQNTISGPFELPEDDFAALTNHVARDQFFSILTDRGVTHFPESSTSRNRRARLCNLIAEREGKADFEEILAFLKTRRPDEKGSIWNSRTIVLTAASPMTDPNSLWLLYPTLNSDFERIDIAL